MISRCLPTLLAFAAVAGLAAAERDHPATDRTGRYTLDTLWIEGGIGPGVSGGDVADVDLGSTTFDQGLDGAWRPGPHVGIEWSRARLFHDGDGWSLGLALWYDRAPGRITAATTPTGPQDVDVDIEVEMLSLAVIPAWVWRFDTDVLERLTAQDHQVEIGPAFSLGGARATLDGGESSAVGLAWQAGLRVRYHTGIAGGWRAGIYGGANWSEARTSWDNTGQAVFTGFSPFVGLTIGYEL